MLASKQSCLPNIRTKTLVFVEYDALLMLLVRSSFGNKILLAFPPLIPPLPLLARWRQEPVSALGSEWGAALKAGAMAFILAGC